MILYAMLYTVAVGVPIVLAAMTLAAVLRHHGRPERLVWLVALALAFALPAVALLDPLGLRTPASIDVGITAAGAAGVGSADTDGVIGLPDLVVVAGDVGRPIGALLAFAWLLASSLLAARWAVAALRLRRASSGWRSETVDGVAVWMTESLGPAVAGALRPRVLVPSWLLSLPARERSLVLLHEQEHIRARDPLVILLARSARVLAPWNPVVWLLCSRLVRAVELDCDRRVLRRSGAAGPDVAAYGRTLLTVASRGPGRLVAVAAFAETEAPLRTRILAMTTPSRTISVLALLSATVLGVVLLVGALEIPVPTLRIQVELGAQAVETVAAETTSPTDGQAGRLVDLQHRGLAERVEALDRTRVATASLDEVVLEVVASVEARDQVGAAASTPQVGSLQQPRFTPYTVAPRILNVPEVQAALSAAYPQSLREAGVGGRVTVWFYVDENGRVLDRRIDQSSGQDALDRAALEVAGVFRFSPALNRDARTAVWVSLPINFMSAQDLSARPQFTPFTTAPRILNVEEVQRALVAGYPPLLRNAGIGGTARVWFFIDTTGAVGNVLVEESSGHEALDQAALEVARTYRFEPARNRDAVVPVWINLPIMFAVAR
ncbi:MAG: M56 family metallopeptidase [Gemmatimonadota bacterium]